MFGDFKNMPKRNTPESIVYTLRLTKEDKAWLDETARACGIEVPQLVRHAIEALRQYVKEHQGRLITPIDIREFWSLIQASKAKANAAEADDLAIAAEPKGPVTTEPRQPVVYQANPRRKAN